MATRAVASMLPGVSVFCPVLVGRSAYGSSSHAPCGPSAPSIDFLIARTVRKPFAWPSMR